MTRMLSRLDLRDARQAQIWGDTPLRCSPCWHQRRRLKDRLYWRRKIRRMTRVREPLEWD